MRRRSWNDFMASTKNPKLALRLLGILKGASQGRIGTFKKDNETFTEPGKESAEHLVRTHFPHGKVNQVRYDLSKKIAKAEFENTAGDWKDTDRIKKAFSGFNNKKSPGPDSIKPIVF